MRLIRRARLGQTLQRRALCRRQPVAFRRWPMSSTRACAILGWSLALRRQVKRRGDRLLDWPGTVHPERKHLHVLVGVDLARQPRNFLAVRGEQDHRRVGAHLEARTQLLRARGVAIDVDGNEEARRSTKSWRLKMVAFTWLHGGHQTAPQYRNRGFPWTFAAAKAASTSPDCQAIPCSAFAFVESAASFFAAVASAVGGGLATKADSGAFEHAVANSETTRTATSDVLFMAVFREGPRAVRNFTRFRRRRGSAPATRVDIMSGRPTPTRAPRSPARVPRAARAARWSRIVPDSAATTARVGAAGRAKRLQHPALDAALGELACEPLQRFGRRERRVHASCALRRRRRRRARDRGSRARRMPLPATPVTAA